MLQIVYIMLRNKEYYSNKLTAVNDILWQNQNNLHISVVYIAYKNEQLVVLVLVIKPLGLTPS